jgi:hypothetical protein
MPRSSVKCPYCWQTTPRKALERRCPNECGAEGGHFTGSKH